MVIAAFLKRPGTDVYCTETGPVERCVMCVAAYIWILWPPRLTNVGCCDVVNLWGATYSPGARVSVLSSVLLLPWDVPMFVCGFSEESWIDAAAVGAVVIVAAAVERQRVAIVVVIVVLLVERRRHRRCCCERRHSSCCCCWAPTLCTAARFERGNIAVEAVSQWVFDKALVKITEQWTAVQIIWIPTCIVDSTK